MKKTKVLFVCLGNICRSPMAEAVFNNVVNIRGFADDFEAFSAGTANYHVGDDPDRRTIQVCSQNNVPIAHKGKQLELSDLDLYDYILAMDHENFQNIKKLVKNQAHFDKIFMMRDFSEPGKGLIVPDPYYGNIGDFENVFNILETSCNAFLDFILKNRTK